jgi:hypothetical protein
LHPVVVRGRVVPLDEIAIHRMQTTHRTAQEIAQEVVAAVPSPFESPLSVSKVAETGSAVSSSTTSEFGSGI